VFSLRQYYFAIISNYKGLNNSNNKIISLETILTEIIILNAHLQVVYCILVKFHQYWFIH